MKPQTPTELRRVEAWLKRHKVPHNGVSCVLFKRVSRSFWTQKRPNSRGIPTRWKPGTTVTHRDYDPRAGECGAGKFHACYEPDECDQFCIYGGRGDRYIAIRIKLVDIHVWPGIRVHFASAISLCPFDSSSPAAPHFRGNYVKYTPPNFRGKVAFRKGRVLYECDKDGKRK